MEPINEHNMSQLSLLDDVLQKESPHEKRTTILKRVWKACCVIIKNTLFLREGQVGADPAVSLWQSSYNVHSRTENISDFNPISLFPHEGGLPRVCNSLLLAVFSITPVINL